MPFSHHSHSGQFCGHAVGSLEQMVEAAIAQGMTSFCLTEHMPRELIDFYPEERDIHTEETLAQLYADFYEDATSLRERYRGCIDLFVGFEGEWIRPSSHGLIMGLLEKFNVELFIGSLHHVHTFPIDFDHELYYKARDVSGGTDDRLFEDYYDSQFDMLQALQPPLVGHFDLIRLKSDLPDQSMKTWPTVWEKIDRNLRFIASYGGVLELNGSAIRKGMAEAYPQVDICKAFLQMGGRFTLSDDSHAVDQVGLNYGKVLDCAKRAGISELVYLARVSEDQVSTGDAERLDDRFAGTGWRTMSMAEVEQHAFWTTPKR